VRRRDDKVVYVKHRDLDDVLVGCETIDVFVGD
jgi:hypothetical protein